MRPTHMKVDGEMNQKYLTANCAEYTLSTRQQACASLSLSLSLAHTSSITTYTCFTLLTHVLT